MTGEVKERENRKIERERGNSGRVRARERGREGRSEERNLRERSRGVGNND